MTELAGWKSDLTVGVEALDTDHKAFFDLAAVLHDAQSADPAEHAMVVRSAMDLLDEYVFGHFLREERAMEKAGYPDLEEHRRQHEDFAAKIAGVATAYGGGDASVADRLPELVVDWLTDHIALSDSKYKGWLTAEVVYGTPLALLVMEARPDDDDEDLLG